MYTDEEEYLEDFEVVMVAITEKSSKRSVANKIWTVAEEKALIDFLMENRGFERPTAKTYYKRIAEVAKCNVDWIVTCNKLRNMRTAYNKAKSWEGSTGAGSMTGETIRATLLRKFLYFYEFEELVGSRLVNNVVMEDTLDESFGSNVLHSTETEETTASSVGGETIPSTRRRCIYSRTGVSDVMQLHTEMMKLKQEKFEKDVEFKEKEIRIREQELELKRRETDLKEKEIESRERMQIREMEMKERLAMEELKLKYSTKIESKPAKNN